MCECGKLFNLLSVIVFVGNVLVTYSFNIDAFNYAVYESAPGSMFGFTVAVHKNSNRGWVLVGAPEAQTGFPSRIEKGGAVYKCRTDGDDPCEEIPFDTEGNHKFGNRVIDDKSHQWFGATLSTSRQIDGRVVACAPRYVWHTRDFRKKDPVGTCFVSDRFFDNFEEYSPCRTSNWGYHRQGTCQAGFSAAINMEGDRLYIGAPGSYYWQGEMYSIDAHASFNFTPGLLSTTYGAKGSVYQQNLESRPAVFSTREGKENDDNSYMGYSTIAGDFLGTGEEGLAVGMPRGASLKGKVLLFSWDLTNYKNISSNYLGSYFGYSLAAADVDGDKKLDLIVGAPMHTEPNTEGKYDVGRVYIFYQNSEFGRFNKSSVIDGFNSKSRFGHSLASLGDLNQDGYEDFAVGAPYDGKFGRGAVYIYYGSAKGVLEKYGQVIYAENVQSRTPVSTFGFSVSGGMDLDGNDYPDMAVGAYLSNSAFFFRSRPVVLVDAFVRFKTENKQIDIERKNCNLPNGKSGTCTSIDFCIKYSGKGIPPQLDLNVQYILDTKKPLSPRMAFLKQNKHTFNESLLLFIDRSEYCKTEEVYIKNEIRDKLTPLEAEVKYFMRDANSASFYGRRNPQSQLQPILDLNSPPSRKDSIIIQKNCGLDSICIPNLHVEVTKSVDKFLLGSNKKLEFDVIVSNFGEDSFETTFELQFPEGIYYTKTESDEPILCSSRENRTIICDIGNPLPANKISKFKVLLTPYHKEGMPPSYEFDMFVNSTNPEDNSTIKDNHKHISMDIWIDSSLELRGKSFPQELYYNASLYGTVTGEIKHESDIGPQVTHVYYLINKGPATVEEAEIFFLWPYATLGDEDLLYLLDQPYTKGNVKCDAAPANYKHLMVERPKSIWERFDIDTSSTESFHSTSSPVHIEDGAVVPGVLGGKVFIKEDQSSNTTVGTGDSSYFFQERYNHSQTSAVNSGMESTGNISQAGVQSFTKTEWRTVYVNGKPITKKTKVTIIKDANGKILNTYYFDDNSDEHVPISSYHPKIIYTSSGGSDQETTQGGTDISIFGKTAHQHIEEQASVTEKSHNVNIMQGSTSGAGIQEPKFHEVHTYQVGGGVREGGSSGTSQQTTHQEGQGGQRGSLGTSHQTTYQESFSRQHSSGQGGQGYGHGSMGGVYIDARENARKAEQRRYEEEQRRSQQKIEEEKRKDEARREQEIILEERRQEAASQRAEEERQRLNQVKIGEERRRQEEERRRGGGTRITEEERLRQESRRREEQIRYDQERRRQEEERRRIAEGGSTDEERRRYEERLRYEEQRRRDEEIRADEARRIDEARRTEEARRRVQIEHERRAGGGVHFGGVQESIEEREQTGYFDEQGNYHDIATGRGGLGGSGGQGGRVVYNKTYTVEGTASIDGLPGVGHGFGDSVLNKNGGLTVQTLDLGTFGGSNDGISGSVQGGRAQSSGSNHHLQGGGSGSASSSGQSRQEWSRGGQSSSGSTIRGSLGQGSQDTYRQEWERRNHWSQGSQIPSTYVQNSVEEGRDNVPTDRPDPNSRFRGRRQVEYPNYADIEEQIKCTSTKCFYIRCVVGTLRKDTEVVVALRSRLNVTAIKDLSTSQAVKLSSVMVARITKLPYIGTPKTQDLYSHEIFTNIPAKETEVPPKVVPLWIILLSAIAGTLILLLVILLLYKCGFFKRNRPSSAPERQPLNRNGYNHGDEAL